MSAASQPAAEAGSRVPLINRIRARAGEKKIPMHTLLELTNNCNLWCRHCYITDRPAAQELELGEIKSVIDQLAEAGCLFLTLTGGDPLMRKDFFTIAAYARQKDFSFSLFTNGTLLTPAAADRLKELAVERVEISLLGAKAATYEAISGVPGSFERAVNGIRLLRERGITVQAKTPWLKLNIDESEEIFSLAESLGVSFRGGNLVIHRRDGSMEPVSLAADEGQLRAMRQRRLDRHPMKEMPPDPPPIPEEAKKVIIPCGIGQTSVRIDSYGNVYPCASVNVKLGNLKTTPFGAIWQGSEELARIRAIRLSDLTECSTCRLWLRCTRCAGLALMETGSLLGPSLQACKVTHALQQFLEEKRCEFH